MAEDDKHHGAAEALDKLQDAAGALVGQMSAALGGGATGAFVKNAGLSTLYEIGAGRLGRSRARSRAVAAFADKMVGDHLNGEMMLQAALSSAEVDEDLTPPDVLDARRQGMLDHLERAADDDFDALYLDQQIAAHDEARTLFATYAEQGAEPSLRSFALSLLPALDGHARAARAIRAAIAG